MTWTWDQIAHRGLLVASALAWLAWGVRRWRAAPTSGSPAIPRMVAPWGLTELAVALFVWVAVLAVGATVGARALDVAPGATLAQMAPDVVSRWLAANGLAMLVATVFSCLAVWWQLGRDAAVWQTLAAPRATTAAATASAPATSETSALAAHGWPTGLLLDVAQGLLIFVVLAGPVLGLQELLASRYPTQHPLVELLRTSPRLDVLWAVGFSAVVVAPLVEELQFRVLLQGWLMRMADAGESRGDWLHRTSVNQTVVTKRFWPVLASAALFAAAHWSHGPDPIPLFLFALGLGEVYRRQRRLIPVVVAHLALNAWSVMLLAAEVLRVESR